MRGQILIFSLFFACHGAFAISSGPRFGAQCGLTDVKNDTWKQGKSYNLERATRKQIEALPGLIKQQLLVAALESLRSYGDSEQDKIQTVHDAVSYFRRAYGPVVTHYIVNDHKVTEVLAFPGDNPVGVYFEYGSTLIVAENGDDDIVCRGSRRAFYIF